MKQRAKEPSDDELYPICRCCQRLAVRGAQKNLGAVLSSLMLADQLVPGDTRSDFGNAGYKENTLQITWILMVLFMGAVGIVIWKAIHHARQIGLWSVPAFTTKQFQHFIPDWDLML